MSNLVSYRKYRPLKFGDVLNQEHVKVTLANAVTNGKVGHAYLFTGPRGVGKTTLARIFARAINCQNMKDGEPCNECTLCQEFINNNSLDLLEIDAASHTGVDNIRELIDHLQFAPTRAKYKIIIVDEVHMLSKGAFNALLKTLEEPPAHAVFVLATTEIHKVPATIISRTQRFDFKKATISGIIQRLKFVSEENGIKASEEALMNIANAADGSFRDSLSLLDQVMSFSQGDVNIDLVEQVLGMTGMRTTAEYLDLIINNHTKEAVNFISNLLYQGRDLYQFQKDFIEYLRKLLIIKVGNAPDSDYTSEMKEKMISQAETLELGRLVKIIEIYQKAGQDIKYSSIPNLPLEIASVEATSGSLVASPVQLASKVNTTITNLNENNPEALSKITGVWTQILDKVKEYNHSLLSSFKLAIPVVVEGNILTVVFPYKFHKDAVEARKNRIVIDQVLEEVTGTKYQIKPILAKDWEGPLPEIAETEAINENPERNSVEAAIKIMGGEIENP